MGALTTVAPTAPRNWTAEDVRPRMSFSLRCAYAHGTRAIRTHLDSIPPQDDITWPVFRELQADWADRIDLQAVCLIGCDKWTDDDRPFGIPPISWRKPRAAFWAWSPTRWTTCATASTGSSRRPPRAGSTPISTWTKRWTRQRQPCATSRS
jgi:hypothetical protein